MASSQKTAVDIDITAEEEDEAMYGHGPLTKEELEQKFPNRPHNHSPTLPFHELYKSLFNPLEANEKKPGVGGARGRKGTKKTPPREAKQNVIESFISRWRKEVGGDFYPAMRLIIPEKDRDRAMYGLKEANIGKILIKILKIDKNSEDGQRLLNWKRPGGKSTSNTAGDFAGRCFEVISKRPLRTTVGDMRIGEVNVLLDKLSGSQKEEDQIPIFQTFYKQMNADELMWLIRIILRQMKVGATQKTFLNLWHPDAESLFNISSSLRRCCWELLDPSVRLGGPDEAESYSVSLMECFQPQLAQFQMHDFKKMIERLMKPKDPRNAIDDDDKEFWIEEKLDGERMQLHMISDDSMPGGKRFAFWSRKAKDYTYLYGNGLRDEKSSLTRYLKDAFDEGVENIILDGEMITWDPETDKILPFGTLKTAAKSEQSNPYSTGPRPLFRVFDILLLNNTPLTKYELKDRREALDRSVKDVHRRLEKHTYEKAYDSSAIEPLLRKVVAEASEGLVLKNPRSAYRLNSRNDDWMKVKPEYMTGFGENLDCVIIGGYYGTGRRGGSVSSFLCGLRVDDDIRNATKAHPEKCLSFFKVGGGFRAEDYASVLHHTDGKWNDWDPQKPPTEYITLAGGKSQLERPDVWIKPSDSVVIATKAASVGPTEQFATFFTVRFPRFKRLYMDKSWQDALTVGGFKELRNKVEAEEKGGKLEVEKSRRATKRLKKETLIAGNDGEDEIQYTGPSSELFSGLDFYIMSERTTVPKKSKRELEEMVKANGGSFFQTVTAAKDILCVADKRLVKVAAVIKAGQHDIVNSSWILDCIQQANIDAGKPRLLLPFELRHMFHVRDAPQHDIEAAVDEYGDSYARDVTVEDLRELINRMPSPEGMNQGGAEVLETFSEELAETPGNIFRDLNIYMHLSAASPIGMTPGQLRMKLASNLLRFCDGQIITEIADEAVTHIVVDVENESADARDIRKLISDRKRVQHIVTVEWIEDSWAEKTLLDEERFAPV